jgi:hypothetical protein
MVAVTLGSVDQEVDPIRSGIEKGLAAILVPF